MINEADEETGEIIEENYDEVDFTGTPFGDDEDLPFQ